MPLPGRLQTLLLPPDRAAPVFVTSLLVAVQAAFIYATYLEDGYAGVLASLFWAYVAVALLIGAVTKSFDSAAFNLALFGGWAALVALGYAVEPTTDKLLFGPLVGLFTCYYAYTLVRGEGSRPQAPS